MQSEQQQRIMGYFIEEAKDHLETIEKGLLKLQETIGDPDRISEVFRAAHSVKGGAAMLGLDSIQHTSHRLEDYFKVLKECPIQVDQRLETLFLRVFDTLQDLLEQLQGPFGLTQEKAAEIMQDVEPIFGELHNHLNGLVTAAGGEALTPMAHSPAPVSNASLSVSPSPAPKVDALQQFFKVTVAKQLKDLLALFKQADTPDGRQQLQSICQTLLTEGKTLSAPAPWQELVSLSQSAIAYPENTYRQLAPIVIKSLKQAQVLGLANKSNEIKPEQALLNLQPPEASEPDLILDDETSIDDLLADVSRDADQVLDSVLENELTLDSDALEPGTPGLDPLDAINAVASGDVASDDVLPNLDESFDIGSGSEPTPSPDSEDEESDLSDLLGIGPDLADEPWTDPSEDSLDLEALESNGTGFHHVESEELSLADSFDLIDSMGDTGATDASPPAGEDQSDLIDELGLEDEAGSSRERLGPQVGPDEMDSLADLFSSDPDSLNIDWPDSDDEPNADHLSDELALDAASDFSDLLFDPSNGDEDIPQDLTADDDDISALLNTLEMGEDGQGDDGELATTPFDSPTDSDSSLDPDVLDSDELGDLLNISTSAETGPLPNDLSDSGYEDFGLDSNGLVSSDEPTLFDEREPDSGGLLSETDPLQDVDILLDANPQTALENDSQLDNLGAFFGGDEDVALGTEEQREDQLSSELSSQEFDELFVGLDEEETIFEEQEFEEQEIAEEPDLSAEVEFAAYELPDIHRDDEPSSADEDVLSDLWAEESEPTLHEPSLDSSLARESLGAGGDDSNAELSLDGSAVLSSDASLPPGLDADLSDNPDMLDTAASMLGLDGDDGLFDSEPVNDSQPALAFETGEDIDAEGHDSPFDFAPHIDPDADLSSVDPSTPDLLDETESTSAPPTRANNVLDSLFGAPSSQEALTVDDPVDINDSLMDAAVSGEVDSSYRSSPMDEQLEVDETQDMASSLGIDDAAFLDVADDGDDSQLTPELDDVLDGIFDQGGGEPIITDPDIPDIAIADGDEDMSLTDMFMQDVADDASVTMALAADNLEFDVESIDPAATSSSVDPDVEDMLGDLGVDASLNELEFSSVGPEDVNATDGDTAFSELDIMLDDVSSAHPELEDDDLEMNEFGSAEGLADAGAEPAKSVTDIGFDVNENGDPFSDLEALLDGASDFPDASADIPSSDHSDSEPLVGIDDADFADLDALLSEDGLGDSDSAPEAPSLTGSDDDFADLEKLLEDADSLGGPSMTANEARQSSSPQRRPARRGFSNQTMRVSVKNLDNLNNLVGELVVNRNSLEQSQERLRQFLDNLLYQVQQLSDVGQRMRDLYERSLLESSLLSSRRSYQSISVGDAASSDSSHATGASFDALEMDRFTGFHTLSQEMIELIVRVRESASDIDFVVDESDQVTRMFRQVTTQLQEGLTRTRMVPFAQAADRLPRAVRDISIKCGKQAKLVVEGRDTLIDKMILEQLYDPMTHLVNNAITHGIESPDARVGKDKNPVGTITIRSFHQGNQTIISVTDDGGGIDPDIVSRKAIEKGLITADEAQEMSRLDIYDLLFHHGFSTRDKADDFAGRGVGMDVVRTSLGEIRGVVNIDSAIDQGTTFTIRLPLTLSISKALLCVSNRARIAFPMDGVEDMLDVPQDRIQADDQGRPAIMWRDILLPFRPLSDLLKFHRSLGRGSVYGGGPEDDVISVVVLRSAGNYLALQVDQVLGEQEIVIKQLEAPIPKPTGIAGATVLGDGRIMPIADVLELIDLSMGRIRRDAGSLLWEQSGDVSVSDAALTASEPTVLIVDDSITVRELLSMTFNKVGYRVEQARDGQEAWEKLRSGLPCDLVFCDIEMPRMDGLELLSRLQKDSHFNDLPIAMLTSRGADRHRQMAVQLGAKGYFTKPYLEEALLDAAQRMLKGEVLVGADG